MTNLITIVHNILLISASLMIGLILLDKFRLVLSNFISKKKEEIRELVVLTSKLEILVAKPRRVHQYPTDHKWGKISKSNTL